MNNIVISIYSPRLWHSGRLFRFYTPCHLAMAYGQPSCTFHYPGSTTRIWKFTKTSIRSAACILPTRSVPIQPYPLKCLVSFSYLFAHPNPCQTSCSILMRLCPFFNIWDSSKPCISGLVYVWRS